MLCSKCGINPATTHYKSIINGKVTEEHLCSDCAEKLNISSFYFPDVFSSILSENASLTKLKRCSVCGSSFSDIKRSGKAGCSNCYTTFKDEILPTISLIHGSTKHIKEETKEAKAEIDLLAVKNEELKKAIADERFEDAARLRDEIKSLKEGK